MCKVPPLLTVGPLGQHERMRKLDEGANLRRYTAPARDDGEHGLISARPVLQDWLQVAVVDKGTRRYIIVVSVPVRVVLLEGVGLGVTASGGVGVVRNLSAPAERCRELG
jgi:hypothetical protein